MQITKANQETLKEFTSFEQSVILAASESRIKALSEFDIKIKITDVVSRAFMNIGLKSMEFEERKALEKLIYDDLKISFPNLTLQEFEIAIYKGSMGEFKKKPDEVIFISPEKIHSWIKSYKDEIKKDIIAKKRAIDDSQDKNKKLSPEQIKEIEKAFLIYNVIPSWKKFKSDGIKIEDSLNAVYVALTKLGLINFTPERKIEIYKQAEEQFKINVKNVSSISDVREANKILAMLERGDSSIKSRIKNLAKQIALEIYLKDLLEMNIDLEELINEKL